MRPVDSSSLQLTAGGRYVNAVSYSLGTRVDFAQLIKVYANNREGEQKYSLPFAQLLTKADKVHGVLVLMDKSETDDARGAIYVDDSRPLPMWFIEQYDEMVTVFRRDLSIKTLG